MKIRILSKFISLIIILGITSFSGELIAGAGGNKNNYKSDCKNDSLQDDKHCKKTNSKSALKFKLNVLNDEIHAGDTVRLKLRGPIHGAKKHSIYWTLDDNPIAVTETRGKRFDFIVANGGEHTICVRGKIGEKGKNTASGCATFKVVGKNNQAPTSNNVSLDLLEDNTLSTKLDATDSDGDPITFILVSNPLLGTLNFDATSGEFTYAPNPNVYGRDSFSFTVSDGELTSETYNVALNIGSVNDLPTITGESTETIENEPVSITFVVEDIDSDSLSLDIRQQPENGTIEIDDATHSITYTPVRGFQGIDSLAISTFDGLDSSEQPAYVNIKVLARVSLVSESVYGYSSNMPGQRPVISANGRYVAWESSASDIVDGDTNGDNDVFVKNLETGKTELISLNSSGDQGNFYSSTPAIGTDGRYVAFYSQSTNLTSTYRQCNGIYLRDRQTGTTSLITVSIDRYYANDCSDNNTIGMSDDGRFVSFASRASNLVAGDDNGQSDVFVRDVLIGKTYLVSRATDGTLGNRVSLYNAISGNGRYVAFFSYAKNLVLNDTNSFSDLFVHDLETGVTERVSISSQGAEGNNDVLNVSMDYTGRYVAFASYASNLVTGDTNEASDIFIHDRETKTTSRVSLNSSGQEGKTRSGMYSHHGAFAPAISSDGEHLTYISAQFNLAGSDNNTLIDGFYTNLLTGVTTHISLGGNDDSGWLSTPSGIDISADGSRIVFWSKASNFVANDANSTWDVFLYLR